MEIRGFMRIAYLESHLPRAKMRTNCVLPCQGKGTCQIALKDMIVRSHRNCFKKIEVAAAEIVIRRIKSVVPGHLIELRHEWLRSVDRILNIGRPAEVGTVKSSFGASLAKCTFVRDQSLSQAVIGACNHV